MSGDFDTPDAMQSTAEIVVGVLIVNYYSARLCKELLDSLAKGKVTSGAEVHVSIVDNSMDRAELRNLQSVCSENLGKFASIVVTPSDNNVGYGLGNNLAFDSLQSIPDVVIVANPDTTFQSGSLRALASEALAYERPIAVPTLENSRLTSGVGKINPWSGKSSHSPAGRKSRFTYARGHFFALSARKWISAHGFAAGYFLYCEEIDLSLRLGTMNCIVPVASGCCVAHAGSATTKEGDGPSLLSLYHANRSRVILYRKHAVFRKYLMPLLVMRVCYAAAMVMRGKPRLGSAMLRGVLSGVRHK